VLQIRQEQFDALLRSHAESHAAKIEQMIGPSFPALREQLGAAEFSSLLRRQIGRAQALGIQELSDLARFASIACALWPDFEADPPPFPWFAEILASTELSPSGKVARLAWWTRQELAKRSAMP